MFQLTVPFFRQSTTYTCGPVCLQMLFAMHGESRTEDELTMSAGTTLNGTPKLKMAAIARRAGYKTTIHHRAEWSDILRCLEEGTPPMVNYLEPDTEDSHYALVVGFKQGNVLLHDPWNGEYFNIARDEFLRRWLGHRVRATDKGWMMTVVR